jgi:oxygen-independent coproporphyrinogen III oxidase
VSTTETQEKTGLGNYFVANYPPFSAWNASHLPAAHAALARPPMPDTPLGLYLHIPFCRKRCKFCYFRVYTDKNARDVETYLDALAREIELLSRMPVVGGRPLHYFYFGGGTPSYLSVSQLHALTDRLRQYLPWDRAAEVTFECEPGTLQQHKLQALKEIGVTRLSLGVENFDDKILEANGRAHLSQEIARAWDWIGQLGFNQTNIDLIAGMVGETWDNWRECIRKTIAMSPDSITVYQMELPFNTVYSKEIRDAEVHPAAPGSALPLAAPQAAGVADWPTKRAWVQFAFDELGKAGYQVSSAYTMVKDTARCKFVYRDSLWHGADMFGTGVASFGHIGGVHVQNADTWEQYLALLDKGELPLARALPVGPKQLLIREMILQMKTGRLEGAYFRRKFNADIFADFGERFDQLTAAGQARRENGDLRLTPAGMLQVDRLLPAFFEPEYSGSRYT